MALLMYLFGKVENIFAGNANRHENRKYSVGAIFATEQFRGAGRSNETWTV